MGRTMRHRDGRTAASAALASAEPLGSADLSAAQRCGALALPRANPAQKGAQRVVRHVGGLAGPARRGPGRSPGLAASAPRRTGAGTPVRRGPARRPEQGAHQRSGNPYDPVVEQVRQPAGVDDRGRRQVEGAGAWRPAKIRRCSEAAVSLKRKPGRIRTRRIWGSRGSNVSRIRSRQAFSRQKSASGRPCVGRDHQRGPSAGQPEDRGDVRVCGEHADHAGSHVARGSRDHDPLARVPAAVRHV